MAKYFKDNDKDHNKTIDCDEFVHMSKKIQLILFPAFQLRDGFRKGILGMSESSLYPKPTPFI